MNKEKLWETDVVDCSKLAGGLRLDSLTGIYVPNEVILEMRSLIRLRSSIVKDTIREKEGVGDITIRKYAALRCLIIEAAWIAISKDPAMTISEKGRMPKRLL